MKKIVIGIVCLIVNQPLTALEKTPGGDAVISTISDYFDQFNRFLIARRTATNESTVPQPKQLLANREQLDYWAHPKNAPQSLEEMQRVNTALFVLGLYSCSGVGGPLFCDNGIRMIQEVLESYAHNSMTLPDSIKQNFFSICKHFLNEALDKGKRLHNSDMYKSLYTLAYLYQLKSPVNNEQYAIGYLTQIIWAPQEAVDIALRNKARVLLAKIYIQQKNPQHNQTIKSLLEKVVESSLKDGQFIGNSTPEDAAYAQSTLAAMNAPQASEQKNPLRFKPVRNSMENF